MPLWKFVNVTLGSTPRSQEEHQEAYEGLTAEMNTDTRLFARLLVEQEERVLQDAARQMSASIGEI